MPHRIAYITAIMPFDPGAIPTRYVIVGVVVIAMLLARRFRPIRILVSLALWGTVAVVLVSVLSERSQLDPYLGRIAALLKLENQTVSGAETRVKMAPDGHFYVRARIGAVERRMLVDSGATVTALSADTAAAAGLDPKPATMPVLLRTANGTIAADTAEVRELRFGNVIARDLAVVVSPAFGDTDILGMNFLSRLKSWRVEDGTLILTPHHPQDGDASATSAPRSRSGG